MSEWISTKDKLPEKHVGVLVTVETKILTRVCIAYRIGDDWHEGVFSLFGDAVTAWMPLPEPYKEN